MYCYDGSDRTQLDRSHCSTSGKASKNFRISQGKPSYDKNCTEYDVSKNFKLGSSSLFRKTELNVIQSKTNSPKYIYKPIDLNAVKNIDVSQLTVFPSKSSNESASTTVETSAENPQFFNALKKLQLRLNEVQQLSKSKVNLSPSSKFSNQLVYGSYLNSFENNSKKSMEIRKKTFCDFPETDTSNNLAEETCSYERQPQANRLKRRSGEDLQYSQQSNPYSYFYKTHSGICHANKTDSVPNKIPNSTKTCLPTNPSYQSKFLKPRSAENRFKSEVNTEFNKLREDCSSNNRSSYGCARCTAATRQNSEILPSYEFNPPLKVQQRKCNNGETKPYISQNNRANLNKKSSCESRNGHEEVSSKYNDLWCRGSFNNEKINNLYTSSLDSDYCVNSISTRLSDYDFVTNKQGSPMSTCCSTNASCSRSYQLQQALKNSLNSIGYSESKSSTYSLNSNLPIQLSNKFEQSCENKARYAPSTYAENFSKANCSEKNFKGSPNISSIIVREKLSHPESCETKISVLRPTNVPPCKNPACFCSINLETLESSNNKTSNSFMAEMEKSGYPITVIKEINSPGDFSRCIESGNDEHCKNVINNAEQDLKKRSYLSASKCNLSNNVPEPSMKRSKNQNQNNLSVPQIFVWCFLSFILIGSIIGLVVLLHYYFSSNSMNASKEELDLNVLNSIVEDDYLLKRQSQY